jgi:hypothetical protein
MDKYTVRNSDGEVDLVASSAAYTKALSVWVERNETSVNRVRMAVNAIFDVHPGRRIPVPALIGEAVHSLSVDISKHAATTQLIQTFIKVQVAAGVLNTYKGKGGGIIRASENPLRVSE